VGARGCLAVAFVSMSILVSVAAQDDLDLPVPTTNKSAPTTLDSGQRIVEQRPLRPPPDKDPRDEPPPVIFGEEIDVEGDTIIFVLDRSGSMAEFLRPVQMGLGPDGQTIILEGAGTPTRLEASQRELVRCVNSLAPNFQFTVFAFDCSVVTWSANLQWADGAAKASASAWINAVGPGGLTATGPATALALRSSIQNQKVVLLTDGIPTCPFADPVAHRRMVSANNTQHAQIDVFGIATEGQSRTFCQQLAADSSGSYFDVR